MDYGSPLSNCLRSVMAPVLDEHVLELMSLTLMLIMIIGPFGGSVSVEPILISSSSMAMSWSNPNPR